MTPFKLSNKVAIVTGASSGIGRATSLELARHGARVALASRNAESLQQLAFEIEALGGEALVIPTDVSQQEQVESMVEQTLSHWGRIDILISNAGQYVRAPISEMTMSLLQHSINVNFYGGACAVLAVLPHMLTRRSGHIVLVSSMDARTCLPPDAPYVAAKCALSGFGEVLRQELRGSGVRSTVVHPGRVDSPMIADLQVPWISAKIPSEAVARAIVRSLRRYRPDVILPPQAGLLYLFRVISPSLMDFAVRLFHLEGWESK